MAKVNQCRPIPHPKYELYKCATINDSPYSPLYRIKLYLIFSAGKVYTLYNSSDWIDMFNTMRESGEFCSTFTHDLYVSPTSHPDIYNEIFDYVP